MQTTSSAAARTSSGRLFSGILFVFLGSASYGMLSTFVKMAYAEGFTTGEVTAAQSGIGALVLTIMAVLVARHGAAPTSKDKLKLMLVGMPMGLTSVVYYVAVQSIDASIAVVLLMQAIWMGVVFESVAQRTWPSAEKIVAVILILIGTLMAVDAFSATTAKLDPKGVFFGILAAVSYTCMLAAVGNVCVDLHPVKRSQYMLYGSLIVALSFAFLTQLAPHYLDVHWVSEGFVRDREFRPEIFYGYGMLLAVFGTVLPPILLNKGFPITGVGLGSIISSIELPFAALIAFALLGESLNGLQLAGIALILGSVVLLNYRMLKR